MVTVAKNCNANVYVFNPPHGIIKAWATRQGIHLICL